MPCPKCQGWLEPEKSYHEGYFLTDLRCVSCGTYYPVKEEKQHEKTRFDRGDDVVSVFIAAYRKAAGRRGERR